MNRLKVDLEYLSRLNVKDRFYEQETCPIACSIAKIEGSRVWAWSLVNGKMIEIIGYSGPFWVEA